MKDEGGAGRVPVFYFVEMFHFVEDRDLVYILFISSEQLGISQSNLETLINGLIEQFDSLKP